MLGMLALGLGGAGLPRLPWSSVTFRDARTPGTSYNVALAD
jgi:hypothetical protein